MKRKKRISLNTVIKGKRTSEKKRHIDYLKIACWVLVPIVLVALVVLDALDIYIFNTERLIVLGVGLLVILLPFFSEVTLKGLSVKRDKPKDHT